MGGMLKKYILEWKACFWYLRVGGLIGFILISIEHYNKIVTDGHHRQRYGVVARAGWIAVSAG